MGASHADHERAALLALLDERPALLDGREGKTGWSTIASEVCLRGSAMALWTELHPPTLDGMPDPDGPLQRARSALRNWAGSDFSMVTVLEPGDPLALRGIHQMPPVLFFKGEFLADEFGVSVVGSRSATPLGRSIAASIAKGLAGRGISVISGLAAGIDTAAHRATLDVGGRPIGVLGTGITRVYPVDAGSRELHRRVAAAGVLASQFLPDAPPQKHTFPMRNVTMSGLGCASVIVEAGEHSGTRIQARVAVDHGRPVILTDGVVKATRWGEALRDRDGVYVAGSTAEVMDIVENIIDTNLSDTVSVLADTSAKPADPA
jgi:DNA protecting protein DprA